MCDDRCEDEIAFECFLFDERLDMYCDVDDCLVCDPKWKDEFNSIKEAWLRECYYTDPHFPGEE